MASASLTIANSANAGLGWSLSECQDNYKRVDGGVILPNDIGTLLQVNAPKADWSVDPEKDSTGIFWWYGKVSRDPFAYQADYTRDGAVDISTRADLEMKKMEKDLQDKDL